MLSFSRYELYEDSEMYQAPSIFKLACPFSLFWHKSACLLSLARLSHTLNTTSLEQNVAAQLF